MRKPKTEGQREYSPIARECAAATVAALENAKVGETKPVNWAIIDPFTRRETLIIAEALHEYRNAMRRNVIDMAEDNPFRESLGDKADEIDVLLRTMLSRASLAVAVKLDYNDTRAHRHGGKAG